MAEVNGTVGGGRRAELVRGAFEVLAEYSHGIRKDVLLREMRERFPPQEAELRRTSRNRDVYTGHVGWGTSEAAAGRDGLGIGWVRKSGDGHWTITEAGRHALDAFPDAESFMAEIKRLKALKKEAPG